MQVSSRKGSTKCALCGIILFKLNIFLACFCRSLVLILCVFRIHRVYRGWFFLLSTGSTHSRIPGGKGGLIFFRQDFFQRSFYVQIGVLQIVSRAQFYAKLSDFYAKLNVTNLYVTNLY